MIEIAIALATKPRVLILDEPAAGVPAQQSEAIFERMQALPRELIIVFVEHGMKLVFRFAERIVEAGLASRCGRSSTLVVMNTCPPAHSNDGDIPLAESLGYQIRLTHRLFQRSLQTEIERHGITLGMWYFLRVLWSEDGITQSELSQRVGTMEPTTLSAIRDMERDGLVRRSPHADDRRKINIHLTEKGLTLRGRLLPIARTTIEAAAAGLTERETTMLIALLKAMQANLQG